MRTIAAVLALGIGVYAPSAYSQHIVRLTWTASTDAAANPSLTYNVYRAATCAGHFAKINSAPVAAISYVDSSIAAGAAYCYEVTSVLASVESTPSNQVTAAVPPPNNRQATCEHHGPIIGWIRCVGSHPKRTSPQSSPQ